MGHLINPISFRLSKSKFWVSNWSFYNKKNYQKYFLEDFNNFNLFKWLLNMFNYKKIGFNLLDVNFIKNFKIFIFNINLMFEEDYIIDVLKGPDIIYKQFFYNTLLFKLQNEKKKVIYKVGNLKKLYNLYLNTKKKKEKTNEISKKVFFDHNEDEFFFLEKNNLSIKDLSLKKYNLIFNKFVIKLKQKKEKIKHLKFLIKNKNVRTSTSKFWEISIVKKKRWRRKRLFKYFKAKWKFEVLDSVFLNLEENNIDFYLLKNIKKTALLTIFDKKKKINKYGYFKNYRYNQSLIYLNKFDKIFTKILDEDDFDFDKEILPTKFILYLLKKYLEYFLKNTFKIKKVWINFFEKFSYRLSSRYIKRFMKYEIYKKGYRIKHIINLIRKDLIFDVSILGFKLGFFGRYQKRLRNKDFYKIKGALSPSNINSVVSYENFVVLLKQGIAGVELCIIKKMKKNEIF